MKTKIFLYLIALIPAIVNAQWILKHQNYDDYSNTEAASAIDFLDKNNGWVGLQQDYLLHTTDGGNSWEKIAVALVKWMNITQIKFFDPLNGLLLSNNQGMLCKTTDGGKTWSKIHEGSWPNAFHFVNKDVGWLIYPMNIYKTTDGGKSWEHQIINSEAGLLVALDSNLAWLTNSQGCFKTLDGGKAWAKQNYTGYVGFLDQLNGWKLNADTISVTKDGGSTWKKIFHPQGAFRIANSRFFDVQNGYFKTFYPGGTEKIFITENGGQNWTELPSTSFNSISFNQKDNLWAAGNYASVLKFNFVKSLKLLSPNGGVPLYTDYYTYITWTHENLAYEKGILEYSLNNGQSWNFIDTVNIADKNYKWATKNIQLSNESLVRIKAITSGFTDVSDSPFSIIKETRQLTNLKVKPLQGDRITPSSTMVVTWEANYETESYAKFSTDPNEYYISQAPSVQIKKKSVEIIAPSWEGTQKIKIEDFDNPQIFTVSEPFRIKNNPSFNMQTNLTNIVWLMGETKEILYDVINIDKYRIDYSIDDGKTWISIANELKADSNKTTYRQSLIWKAPNTLLKKCRIKLSSLDNPSVFLISNSFELIEEKTLATFPLKIGNKWFYNSWHGGTHGTYTVKFSEIWEVVDTVRFFDGLLYYKILNKFRSDEISSYESSFFYINLNKSHITFSYDLNKQNCTNYLLYDANISIDNLFGRNLKSYTIKGYGNNYTTFTDSIGYKGYSASGTNVLVSKSICGCVLDNKVYGLTDKENPKENVVPFKFSLSQNYPNPFNPSTIIDYQLQTPGFVTLKVYDLLGREVATLVDEYKSAGTYKVTFDVKTRHGASLQSGVYFYRLTSGSYNETKKLVLLK